MSSLCNPAHTLPPPLFSWPALHPIAHVHHTQPSQLRLPPSVSLFVRRVLLLLSSLPFPFPFFSLSRGYFYSIVFCFVPFLTSLVPVLSPREKALTFCYGTLHHWYSVLNRHPSLLWFDTCNGHTPARLDGQTLLELFVVTWLWVLFTAGCAPSRSINSL